MRARSACLGLVALALGCGPGVAGTRTFDEIGFDSAARALDEDGARLVQVRETGSPRAARVLEAALLASDSPVPERWVAEARPVLVIAADPAEARRAAARLVRSGLPRVSIVRGGIEAWLDEMPAAETPATAQRPTPGAATSSNGKI